MVLDYAMKGQVVDDNKYIYNKVKDKNLSNS